MTFPLISSGRTRLDRIASSRGDAVQNGDMTSATESVLLWRLQLTRLSEMELRDVEMFIRAVKTQESWSLRVGDTRLYRCLLVEARKDNWRSADGIQGWLVFSAARMQHGTGC